MPFAPEPVLAAVSVGPFDIKLAIYKPLPPANKLPSNEVLGRDLPAIQILGDFLRRPQN
jgi:hypothetical protein